MTKPLQRVLVSRLTGEEPFTDGGRPLGFDLLAFWQWSGSELIGNTTRGVIAEYLVAQALGVDVTGIRNNWDSFDLRTASGTTVEVKSSAYMQSWAQDRPSSITFRIKETHAWNADTGKYASEVQRQAEVYVFAILATKDKPKLNPLDVNQWEFRVVATRVLDTAAKGKKSIGLAMLDKVSGGAVAYAQLASEVRSAVSK